jgi:cell wall-associated NlpC family hydrolase
MSDTDIPGNVGELEALATQLSTAVDTVRTIKVGVTDDLSDWTGTGATAFRAVLEQFTPGFERADAALAYGSTAIARFAGELGDFQTSAASYLREIDASQEALDNANARRVAAEQAVEREIRAVAHNPVHAITAELDAARAELDEVNSLVDRFTLDLQEWLNKASANYSAYQDAVRTCTAAINDLITGNSTNIEIHNGDIYIQPIGAGTLNLGALTKALNAEGSGSGVNVGSRAASAMAWAETFPQADTAGHSYDGRCLQFVSDAYHAKGFWNYISPSVPRDPGNTYPADIWGHFTAGTTGTGTPPPGALVFWGTEGNRTMSHVAISLGGGNLVSTSDGYDNSGTHPETMADHDYAVYDGWWLPPQ